MPAIPTKYRRRQYRSILEAKWAAFFDLLKWPVEYEPFEMDGWIPDFIIAGKYPVLVEVKPELRLVDWDKVTAPGYETLCVSGTPFAYDQYKEHTPSNAQIYLGVLTHGTYAGPATPEMPEEFRSEVAWRNWGVAPDLAVFTCHGDLHFDFCGELGDWTTRVHGDHRKEAEEQNWATPAHDSFWIDMLWTEAGNLTQWKRPRAA